ncbi:peptidase M23 [Roseovarius sp. SCSIO 43702]|uniref:murein hydrolase activator EnvC family protein n=1 Tax=Roseovarius sp. SCSIO 43702 TaxID=2823043 RepID=UPI001C739EF7|nr:peptidase M23 [Roseovarius sp. SCSIO 43702]QYX56263.1 peptidase M23 [Roseovarius sp. SCSIO 43702]
MTVRALITALVLGIGAGPGSADTPLDAAEAARRAAQALEAASRSLDEAEGARNRVRALTETVRAYEDGLTAMRDGLRRAAIREEALTRELTASEAEIAQLLGILQSMDSAPSPVLLLHPSGPLGTARSGLILSDVTPALNAEIEALRSRLSDLAVLRALQESAAQTLRDGLKGAQTARVELSQAIADRTDLPRRFTEDATRTALLIAATESLEGFASGLSEIAVDEAPGSLPDISDRKGTLPLPVEGRILRRAGEADAAGITRPGLIMATPPNALVTTPTAATLRYSGPLLDYGNVAILEPQAGLLLVFAGLDVVYGETGEVLPGGSPVGLMGGDGADADGILPGDADKAGSDWSETLYIEVREQNEPVDPETWFRTDKG